MKVYFITTEGGATSELLDVEANTTVADFVQKQLGYALSNGYAISVNKNPISPEQAATQKLRGFDRVCVSPRKQDVGNSIDPNNPSEDVGDGETDPAESTAATDNS